MSDLVGWIAKDRPDSTGLPGKRTIAQARPQSLRDFQPQIERSVCHLALSTNTRPSALSDDGEIIAAIEGYPRWSVPNLAARAKEVGHAKVLAEVFRERGVGLLDDLMGTFSLAVLNHETQEAVLAIDRYGIGTLCHAESGSGRLIFASTADVVRSLAPELGEVSTQAIFDFFYFVDRVPAPHTIFEGIQKLPPAHFLHLKDGRIRVEPYWRMTYETISGCSEAWFSERLIERLRSAVTTSVTNEEPAGMGCFLSGGLDSSTVLALLSEVVPQPARSFTIGFEEDGFDESCFAELAAQRFGSRHETYILQPSDVLEALPEIATVYDEPFANSSCLPAFFCALRAREAGLSVLLAGDGGDELFAGNSRYLKDRVFDPYSRIPAIARRFLIEPLIDSLPAIARVPLLRKLRNYVLIARLPVAERMHVGNLFSHFRPERIFSTQTLDEINQSRPSELVDEIFAAAGPAAKVQKLMHLDMRVVLADSDLRKVTRMCELAGMRVRFPFLDDELVAFSARIPPKLLMKGGVLRGFYKSAVQKLLPREILKKEKGGFGLPYVPLLASYPPLNQLACDCLEGLGSRGWFRKDFLDSMIESLAKDAPVGVIGYVWDLMVLELWCQAHLDSPAAPLMHTSAVVGEAT